MTDTNTPRTAVRVRIEGGAPHLPVGTRWKVAAVSTQYAPGGIIGEDVPQFTVIDFDPIEAEAAATNTPRTAAGRNLLRFVAHGPGGYNAANRDYWLPLILAIEAEAAAPTPATGNASKRNPVPPRINVVADTPAAPTPAELPRTRGDGTVAYEPSDEADHD